LARRKKGLPRAITGLIAAAGVILLYWGVTTGWGLVVVGKEQARIEKRNLHTRAKTLALDFRRQSLNDPVMIRMIAEKRLGMRGNEVKVKVPAPRPDSVPKPDTTGDSTSQ